MKTNREGVFHNPVVRKGDRTMYDVIIIGSGPYGISLAAHAVANQLSYKLFGYPMDFWKNQMPQDMFIRTPYDFVSFSDSKEELTIHHFSKETGRELTTPLPRPVFVEYADWFARKAGVQFTTELVTKVSKKEAFFEVVSESGERLMAKKIIVATGVSHYQYIPEFLRGFPSNLVSHTSGHTNFVQFKGKKVVVLGSGQSAWEAAGLLYREGADVELIYRKPQPNYAGGLAEEIALRDAGDTFYHLTIEEKQQEWGQAPGNIAHFLKPYVEGLVPQKPGAEIRNMEQLGNEEMKLLLSDGEERIVNHVIVATGYHINLDKVPFLEKSLLGSIEREDGNNQFPRLNEAFESSVQGLYFAGPLSSHSHGPTFRFILGLKKTSFSIIPSIVKRLGEVTV